MEKPQFVWDAKRSSFCKTVRGQMKNTKKLTDFDLDLQIRPFLEFGKLRDFSPSSLPVFFTGDICNLL
ncbi:hypothetical protein LEP1GSC073_1955 [Leptospira noguchii str. Cascata]|nr:hypothetical protein LEP1GSC073_1955 [Leptospira noguchii str. Cascata]